MEQELPGAELQPDFLSVGLINTIWACALGVVAQQAPTSTACTITFTVFPAREWDSWLCFHVSSIDKKLVVAIEGSVEEAKALYKPPEDSQGELGGVAAGRGVVFWGIRRCWMKTLAADHLHP